jgi:RNA-directed DNA polymerase
VKLVKASDTKIQRHVKISGEANPFDPSQEAYFEDRLGWKIKDSLTGQAKLLRLWWSQNKPCPICGERITKDSGWNVHHLLPKSEGGKDNLSNLVLVHPTCHRQIHSRKLTVAKPAPAREL